LDQSTLKLNSQITSLYYRDLESADAFYREIMGLALVQDQGWAKIYRVSDKAFVGAVSG
jgi:lactoylglutathione lyase